MTDEEMSMCIGLAETRLSRHGRATLRASNDVFSEPTGVTVVDGEPVILHYDRNNPTQITTYAIDKTMTMGQFIDTFNTTMTMMYGSPVTINPVPLVNVASHYGIGSIGIASKAPSHALVIHDNASVDLGGGEVRYRGQSLDEKYASRQEMVETCERILADRKASKAEKLTAAQALTHIRKMFGR